MLRFYMHFLMFISARKKNNLVGLSKRGVGVGGQEERNITQLL